MEQVGSVSGVHFVNISITTKNGIFLAGSQGSMLQSIEFNNVSMNFVSSTIPQKDFTITGLDVVD